MKFDPVDIFGEGIGYVITRAFAYLGCLWMGSVIGLISVLQLEMFSDIDELFYLILFAPVSLINLLLPFTLTIMIVAIFLFKSDRSLMKIMPIFTALLSLMVMLRETRGDPVEKTIQWTIWLGFMGTLFGVFWYFRKVEETKYAMELEELYRENEQRRQELQEKFGTASFGSVRDNQNTPENFPK